MDQCLFSNYVQLQWKLENWKLQSYLMMSIKKNSSFASNTARYSNPRSFLNVKWTGCLENNQCFRHSDMWRAFHWTFLRKACFFKVLVLDLSVNIDSFNESEMQEPLLLSSLTSSPLLESSSSISYIFAWFSTHLRTNLLYNIFLKIKRKKTIKIL